MPRVVTFHYKLTNKNGKVLDYSENHKPLTFMEGAGMIIDGLEKQMFSLNAGDKKKILVPAAEAYGAKEEGNDHPLAGQDLTFDIEIMKAREATKEEIEHGHAHGEHGHGH